MYLFACHLYDEEQVLERVELEHVGHGDRTGLDDGIERQRSRQRDFGTRQLELQVVDEVGERRVAKEALSGVDGRLEVADDAVAVLVDFINLGLEGTYHLLVYFHVADVHVAPVYLLAYQLAVGVFQYDVGLADLACPARRVEQQHLSAFAVLDPEVVLLVVVAEEHDVESRYLAGYGLRGILLVAVSPYAAALAGVEQAEDQVALFHLLQVLHPLLGTAYHFLKLQPFPYRLVQPVGDGWRQHTDDGNLHAFAVEHGVGVDVGQAGCRADDVGPQRWAAHLANPLVVDLMARLDVVVADGLAVVLHVVHHLGSYVLLARCHEVRPVACGLSLQYVAVVNQQQLVAVLLAEAVHVGVHPRQRSLDGLCFFHEVVGEEVAVYVARLHHLQPNGFLCLCHCSHGQARHHNANE